MMPLAFKNLERPPEDLARGLAAAAAVFERAGVSPAACHADVQRARHGSQTWYAAARLWYAAENAAVRAACGSWRDAPLAAALEFEP
jgi:hypothetical protein